MEIFKKLKKYSWMLPIFKNASKEDRANFVEGYKQRKTYYTMDNIDANIKDLARCALCPNMCRFDCPAVQVTKKEPYAPAQKARIGYFMAMDYLPMNNSSAIDTLYQCMGCDACYQWCPMDISTGDLLFEMRAELEKRDLIPERLHPLANIRMVVGDGGLGSDVFARLLEGLLRGAVDGALEQSHGDLRAAGELFGELERAR